uniref:DUF2969 family protein n=1 Tax=Angiostrongylus cantonensis TaxID=6313 RepID=A0A0K0CU36_ANGCA
MSSEKINMMEFAHKGALVMQDVKGEVKHALEGEKSGEIVRVQYDTGQNEIVTIGSDVEIIKVLIQLWLSQRNEIVDTFTSPTVFIYRNAIP